MTSSYMPTEALAPEPARQCLATLLERVLAEALTPSGGHAVRVEIPVKPVDALAWLQAQEDGEKIYWSDRAKAFEAAGVGAADVLTVGGGDIEPVFAQLQQRLASAHPHLRYFGGLCFNPEAKRGCSWRAFGAGRFVLPRFEVLNEGTQSYLACNLTLDDAHDLDRVLDALAALRFPEETDEAATATPVSREDRPNRAGWSGMIERALALFEETDLEKIVLAREAVYRFDEPLNAVDVLRRLSRRADRAYCFLVQPEPGAAFLGASPERLYRRQGRYIEAEAVAGTRPRGTTPESDAVLSQALLESEKDEREHRFVVEALRRGLAALCSTVQDSGGMELLRLPECQHLYRRLEGILTEPYSDAAILRMLHPTPAVGGYPSRDALEWIDELEPFDRGWYAGPLGWVARDSSEFAVAIRCGLVHGSSFSAFTGAGIVSGSTTAGEWEEIENKMSNLSGILTGHDH